MPPDGSLFASGNGTNKMKMRKAALLIPATANWTTGRTGSMNDAPSGWAREAEGAVVRAAAPAITTLRFAGSNDAKEITDCIEITSASADRNRTLENEGIDQIERITNLRHSVVWLYIRNERSCMGEHEHSASRWSGSIPSRTAMPAEEFGTNSLLQSRIHRRGCSHLTPFRPRSRIHPRPGSPAGERGEPR